MTAHQVVIVGAGQASAVATRTLRRRGFDGLITIVGDEPERPYQRPPLSKEYLTDADESGLYLLPEEWTEAQKVVVRTGVRATRVSAADGGVEFDDGSFLMADQVLLTTGGSPRRLPNSAGDRIRYLRSKADADGLREHLLPGTHVLVIGAGFIGAEVASSARQMGADVTILEVAPVPLAHVLGERLGAACALLHARAAVDLRVGVLVESVVQEGEQVVVRTSEGALVADFVVVGIGITPNDDMARESGIEVGDGVLVDEFCRTSMPNVFAAGDVANHFHPLFDTRMRVEHFDNANRQAAAAANNMLGRATVFDDPHWFWSDQYGANLQYVGHTDPSDRLLVRGSLEEPEWSAFFLRGETVRAAFAIDRAEDIMVARELISAQATVVPELLADPTNDLTEILEQM